MAYRALVQVVITGTKVFSKAFAEAYKQASVQSTRQGSSDGTNTRKMKEYGGITLDESCKILNVEKDSLDPEKIKKNYDYLFSVNDKEHSGSFYLQSKIFRASERLKYELAQRDTTKNKDNPDTTTSTPPAQDNSTENKK